MRVAALLLASSAAWAAPRALPTFVRLDLDRFPRPAAQACARHREVAVRTAAGLEAALAALKPGTTLRVAAGTYRLHAGESEALPIAASGVCLRGDGVIIEAAPAQGYGLLIRGDRVAVEGFTFRGFQTSVSIGADRPLAAVTLERLRVEGPAGDWRDGIVVQGALDGWLLRDVHVEGSDLGISCNQGPCRHVWVERATVAGRRTGSGNSGGDAFAIEEGAQIAVIDSTFRGAEADGIDTKADDVVVSGCKVLGVGRNALKLWRGGDVINTVLDGSGADASLIGDRAGRYRYRSLTVRNHAPDGTGYVGTWGYDHPKDPGMSIEILDSLFERNSAGGLFFPAGARVSIRKTVYRADAEAKLAELSDGRIFALRELAAFDR